MVLNEAVQIVNFVKSRPLQNCSFLHLREFMGSEHKTLLLHTEIRRLSKRKVCCKCFVWETLL